MMNPPLTCEMLTIVTDGERTAEIACTNPTVAFCQGVRVCESCGLVMVAEGFECGPFRGSCILGRRVVTVGQQYVLIKPLPSEQMSGVPKAVMAVGSIWTLVAIWWKVCTLKNDGYCVDTLRSDFETQWGSE